MREQVDEVAVFLVPLALIVVGLLGFAGWDALGRWWSGRAKAARPHGGSGRLWSLLRRADLGDLTPVQKVEHDGWTATVYQERRMVRGRETLGWVVVDEHSDGETSWRRYSSQAAAVARARDDGFMAEW